jgi:hypothetical protein
MAGCRAMAKRRPPSLAEFLDRFPDDEACETHLAAGRWPDDFVWPACGGVKG